MLYDSFNLKKTERLQRDEIVALVWEKRLQLYFSFHNGLNFLVWSVSLAGAEE